MSNIKTKELIICLISIVALVLTITTNAFAMNIEDALKNNNEPYPTITDNTNNNGNNNKVPGTTTNNNNSNNTNNTNNTTATIPYTGIDYSVVLIIAICGVSAIYAYKKIRDYNV